MSLAAWVRQVFILKITDSLTRCMIPHITGFTLETFVVISDRGLQFPQGNRVSVVWLMGYYDEAQASLCKFADLSESSLSAHEILILIALSSNYTCTNEQTHQSLPPGWIEQKSPSVAAHKILAQWRRTDLGVDLTSGRIDPLPSRHMDGSETWTPPPEKKTHTKL